MFNNFFVVWAGGGGEGHERGLSVQWKDGFLRREFLLELEPFPQAPLLTALPLRLMVSFALGLCVARGFHFTSKLRREKQKQSPTAPAAVAPPTPYLPDFPTDRCPLLSFPAKMIPRGCCCLGEEDCELLHCYPHDTRPIGPSRLRTRV